MLWLAALASASERHGFVKFGGLPLPGATVTATQSGKSVVAVTDPAGAYFFPDLADGVWTFDVGMLCFVPVKQEITLGTDAAIPDWELKLLALDDMKAMAAPLKEPSPVSVAINAPATPAAPAAPSNAAPAKNMKKTPPPPANTPGGFQRTQVNASSSAAPPGAHRVRHYACQRRSEQERGGRIPGERELE